MTETDIVSTKKKITGVLIRVGIWVVGLMVIYAVTNWLTMVYSPVVSASAAVDQLNGGDEEFIAMQTAEMAKNSITTIAMIIAVIWSGLIGTDLVVRSGIKLKEAVEENV